MPRPARREARWTSRARGVFGVASQEARGHVVTTILIGMVAMLLTAVSYGRMARACPGAGSASRVALEQLRVQASGQSPAFGGGDQEHLAVPPAGHLVRIV